MYNLTIQGRESYDEVDEQVACSNFFLNAVKETLGDSNGKTTKSMNLKNNLQIIIFIFLNEQQHSREVSMIPLRLQTIYRGQ